MRYAVTESLPNSLQYS